MFFVLPIAFLLTTVILTTNALPYQPDQVPWNLNQNESATSPLDYWGSWDGHVYHESPTNWRFPFYTIFLDRFVNGDPTNDNANGSVYEHDLLSNQFRNGGDVQGLVDSLDYLQGMGIKVGKPKLTSGHDCYRSLLTTNEGFVSCWKPPHQPTLGRRQLQPSRSNTSRSSFW